jgi:SAM-dependent methyltransferase
MSYIIGADGIYYPQKIIQHCNDQYDQADFSTLVQMQEKHFWYRGRHKFILSMLDKYCSNKNSCSSAIDLGGGAGGWINYLHQYQATKFCNLALGDSSTVALSMASSILPPSVKKYHVDLMDLRMNAEWDAIFMLDVIEHLPDDLGAIEQARDALKPGGLLLITAPAFKKFWSYNDELALHLRRYSKADFEGLAKKASMQILDVRYFMFFLSPLYILSRKLKNLDDLSYEEKKLIMHKQHQIPQYFVNNLFEAIFSFESILIPYLRFPWGTSLIGVFQKL